jgi:hypothetical protein
MAAQDHATERWPGKKSEQRAGYYEHKNVRFKLARSSVLKHGWSFQPFGREPQEFATWDETITGLEDACTAIALHRSERRQR